MRNLSILQKLFVKGQASLEELAKEAKCRQGELSASLRVLQEQGIISKERESYVLKDGKSVFPFL